MATKGYLMLLGGMREIERILKERMHEDEETIAENGVCVLVESMADQIDALKQDLEEALAARPVEGKAEAGIDLVNLGSRIEAFLYMHIDHIDADISIEAMADQLSRFYTRPIPAASTEGLREAFESMVYQFAYDGRDGTITTGGLSALEDAFELLGWDDPHKLPREMLCDEPGCGERSTCGTPTPSGYRRVCGKHYAALSGEVGK